MNDERGTRGDPRAETDGAGRPGGLPYQAGPVFAGGVTPGGSGSPSSGVPKGGEVADGGEPLAADGSRGPARAPIAPGSTRPGGARPAGPARRARHGKSKGRSWWIELPILLAFALVLALLIKTFVVQAFFIPSSSMENTLEIGDKVLVNKMVYDFRPIHRGDVVVFNGEGSWDPVAAQPTPPLVRLWNAISGLFGTAPGVHDYIKRVIGIPGDHVACCDAHGRVTVNGVPLNERSYLFPGNPPSTQTFSITVPPGRLWVMGDHRSVSYDSRGHMQDPGGGTVPEDRVVGRAFVIVAPISRWRVLPIPATFDQGGLAQAAAMSSRTARDRLAQAAGMAAPPALSGPVATAMPLGLGFAGAVPLTWLQLRLRRRLRRARSRRGRAGNRAPAGPHRPEAGRASAGPRQPGDRDPAGPRPPGGRGRSGWDRGGGPRVPTPAVGRAGRVRASAGPGRFCARGRDR